MKKIAILLIVAFGLGIGLFVIVSKERTKNSTVMKSQVIQDDQTQLEVQSDQNGAQSTTQSKKLISTPVISAKTTQAAGTMDTKVFSELDQNLQKELDQLDADIKAGNKDILTDSDFNF